MRIKDIILEKNRVYTGEPLETGGTSIAGGPVAGVKLMLKNGVIKPNMKVLDYGAGKYGRNAEFLRQNGIECFAFDPFNGTDPDGYSGVSKTKPNEKFDVVFTSYVLNVVPEHVEDDILRDVSSLGDTQFHITRNKDITATVVKALNRKDKLVGDFFLNNFANEEEKQMYEDGNLTPDVIDEFVKHGVKTSKGFQRIPFLEEKGFTLIKNTTGYKIYIK